MRASAIGWTDYSGGDLNFVTGCSPVSEGCRNCYAWAMHERFGKVFTQVECRPEKLERLRGWRPREFVSKRENARQRGRKWSPMAFVCDTGDICHEQVPESFLWWALQVMATRDDIIWQVLTKRPRRLVGVLERIPRLGEARVVTQFPRHMWLGVSVETQARAEERLPLLLQVPALRWVSVEPMLEPVDLRPWLSGLSWVVCGGESGPRRRPFDVRWAADLHEQCREYAVPFFYKQGSAWWPGRDDELPGVGTVKEWPEDVT